MKGIILLKNYLSGNYFMEGVKNQGFGSEKN